MGARLILAAAFAVFLASCQTTSGDFCDIAKPTRLSAEQVDRLSDAEVRQILSLNEKGQKLCQWKP